MGQYDSSESEKAFFTSRKKSNSGNSSNSSSNTLPPIVKMEWSEGTTQVRFLTPVKFTLQHWFERVKRNSVCPKTDSQEAECFVCESGMEPKAVYFALILDRKDRVIKVAKWYTYKIKTQLRALEEAFGNPLEYDILVTKTGTEKPLWTLFPFNKGKEVPLTEEEKNALKNSVDINRLYKITDKKKVEGYFNGVPPENSRTPETTNKSAEVPPKTSQEAEEVPDPLENPEETPF